MRPTIVTKPRESWHAHSRRLEPVAVERGLRCVRLSPIAGLQQAGAAEQQLAILAGGHRVAIQIGDARASRNGPGMPQEPEPVILEAASGVCSPMPISVIPNAVRSGKIAKRCSDRCVQLLAM